MAFTDLICYESNDTFITNSRYHGEVPDIRNWGSHLEDKTYDAIENREHWENLEKTRCKAAKLKKTCHLCKSKTNLSCGNCRIVYYCSKDCQKKDWKNHKLVCNKKVIK